MADEVFGDASRNGDWAAVRLSIDGDRVVDSDAEGLDESLVGLTMLEAASVGGDALAVEALASALGQVFAAEPRSGRVAVAMSGGVDSAVSLLRAGPSAIGVTLRLWQDPAGPSAERACCSPAAVAAARATCHALGLPHVTLDLREEFRSEVVTPFVSSYREGETPNPCTRCNGAFRFDALLGFAARAGAEKLWTGHYARIVERGGRRLLARGADPRKDQSYMLATVDPGVLDRVEFPLGEQSKEETRAEAVRAGLAAASRPESQEACFLAGDDYRRFLERQGLAPSSGDVVDESGRVLGRHEGYWRFTPGQRRGLGIAAARPLYVLRTDRVDESRRRRRPRRTRRLTRGGDRNAVRARITRRGDSSATGRIRCSQKSFRAHDGFALDLEEPSHSVACGQVAALYDGDAVVGAGVVTGVS